MKFLKLLPKIFFCLPILLIILQTYSILRGLFLGAPGWVLNPGLGPGFDAMIDRWFWGGFAGIIYVPFLIYQIVYLKFTKQKLFKQMFIIQLILILILEAPLLIELISHGF